LSLARGLRWSDHIHAYRLDAGVGRGAQRGARFHQPAIRSAISTGKGDPLSFKEGRAGRARSHSATEVTHTPDSLAKYLGKDELRLYRLIWQRFVASQMMPALFDQTTIDIQAGRSSFAHRFGAEV